MKGIVIAVASTENDHQFEEEFSEDSTYACLSTLQCNKNYFITVKAENVNGTSVNNPSLFVPSVQLGMFHRKSSAHFFRRIWLVVCSFKFIDTKLCCFIFFYLMS